jgi:DUF4097 and DUF4098 domain-containing protein YvlB
MPAAPIAPTRRIRLPRCRSGMLIGSLALSGALVAGGCGYNGWEEPHYDTRTMLVPHVSGSALSLATSNGSIEALATDRADVSIEVVLKSPDLERLDLAQVHANRMGDGSLSIWVEWPGEKRKNNEGASISVNLPDAPDIRARSSNGSITIAGLSGHADLKSSNGSIRVDTHDGSVHADSSNGKLIADKVSGEIEMYSSNGRISISDAFGPIHTESSNGSVVVSTMPGNAGPVRIRTSNGPVTLNLGEGLQGILKCDTSNGRVTVSDLNDAHLIESSNKRVEIRLGEGDEISAVRTSNGPVRVQGR